MVRVPVGNFGREPCKKVLLTGFRQQHENRVCKKQRNNYPQDERFLADEYKSGLSSWHGSSWMSLSDWGTAVDQTVRSRFLGVNPSQSETIDQSPCACLPSA